MNWIASNTARSWILGMCIVGAAGWFGTGCGSGGEEWAFDDASTRLPVVVTAPDDRPMPTDYPLTIDINLDEIVDESADSTNVRMVEIGEDGTVVDDRVPVQLDRFSSDEAAESIEQVTFLMEGRTPPQQSRTYHLYRGSGAGASTGDPGSRAVELAGEVMHEGQESFEIRTDNAAYFYHKRGAGFASILDEDGNDWISYNPGVGEESESGSGGMYRGIPNAGHPEGYAHPGDTISQSKIISEGPVRVSILSTSNDGEMRARWDFYPRFARLTFLEMRTPYWFLYEGTPGGNLDMKTDYLVRQGGGDSLRTPASEEWTGDITGDGGAEWLYVGDSRLERVLYLIHHGDDSEIDSYWPMNEEMTVFGFGRRDLEKFMERVPARFTIGLHDGASSDSLRRHIESIYHSPNVNVGPPEQRP